LTTITADRQAALADLVEAVSQVEALTDQVGPFALYPDACDRVPELVAAVCRALRVPLSFDARPTDRDFALVAMGAEIQRAQRSPALADLRPGAIPDAVAEAKRRYDDENAGSRVHAVRRPDDTVLTAVEAGPAGAPWVLISPPPSMSYRLSLPWLRALSPSHRCLIGQTRGTSERIDDPADFDRRGSEVSDQAGDLLALLDELTTGPVHLMGICGGATVALEVAARRPGRIVSLSLWHPALELGAEVPRTDHEANLRALVGLAGESRDTAAWLRDRLTSGPMTGVPDRVGPLVVRPYATTELFYRYARLTGATMRWDSRRTAAAVSRPALVVTSENDSTAHPAVARRLAEVMPGARLVVTGHGTHLDAFRATAEQLGRLTSFLA
jgi:pimeloyl-ACP methyl ester carboxylesterase